MIDTKLDPTALRRLTSPITIQMPVGDRPGVPAPLPAGDKPGKPGGSHPGGGKPGGQGGAA